MIRLAPRVAAAIVTYNHREAVLQLLERLDRLSVPSYVTENACQDGTRQAIQEKFPHVNLLQSPANLGGCGGFNCAILAALNAHSKYIVLLDDDVMPELDCLNQLADFLDQNDEYVCAAPAIYISSKPDTLQEAGGGVDFNRKLPVEAWYRFHVNPKLPEVLDTDYASACCLMVRTEAIRELGVMDWNFFIFSDDVDWTLRLRAAKGKAACVTQAKAYHDFPWAKPFSPMRLYFFQRNGLYLISRHTEKNSHPVALKTALMQILWKWFYSYAIGDKEYSETSRQAFMDAWHGRYGAWQPMLQFDRQRPRLNQDYFRQHNIRRVLLDITIEALDEAALRAIQSCANQHTLTIDLLCDAHRVTYYQQRGQFAHVFGRKAGRIGHLKAFWSMKFKRYDLVVTDAFMDPRRPASMAGKQAAFFQDGQLYAATSRPWLAASAYLLTPLLAFAVSRICYRHFLVSPELGMPPDEAKSLLQAIGFDPEIGQPWAPIDVMTSKTLCSQAYVPPVAALTLGVSADSGGYDDWCRARDQQVSQSYTMQYQVGQPLFSIVVPVCNPQLHWLQQCIDSVRSQYYAGWELILVDDASTQSDIQKLLSEAPQLDSRIQVIYLPDRSGISNTTNQAAKQTQGDYLLFLDHDDLLDAYALSACAQTLAETVQPIDLLYADEDRFNEQYQRVHPGFKPDYSPDLLLATNYIHHPVVVRRSLFLALGGLRSEYDGSQDLDFLLRLEERSQAIVHIADVLYHMRLHSDSLSANPDSKPDAHNRGRQAIAAALKRRQIQATVKPIDNGIAGHNHVMRPLTDNVKVSVLTIPEQVIDIDTLSTRWPDCECLLPAAGIISKAEQLNTMAQQATGDIVIIASSELRLQPSWQQLLFPHVLRSEIGLVSGKLSYDNGRLYSCGLTLGLGELVGRWHHDALATYPGYGGWMRLDHEVSALPWQWLAVRREVLLEAGLFNIGYKYSGFELELALTLSQQFGLRHLVIPAAQAVLSTAYSFQPQLPWHPADKALFQQRWGHVIRLGDPYFNKNFSLLDEAVCFKYP